MKHELSVLIPVHNSDFRQLVKALAHQLSQLSAEVSYEIIVADDGSTDRRFLALDEEMLSMPHFRLIAREENVGRAAIRNFLAKEAKYRWLLFLDCDMTIENPDFISNYLTTGDDQLVVCGGYQVGSFERSNLRFLYEETALLPHSAEARRQQPYHHFYTANFLASREVMMAHPFDERFRRYGYEDVLFGKRLKQNHIGITHIDNTVGFNRFDSNEQFVGKTEEGLRTLHEFRDELRGYSRLLTFVEGIHLGVVCGAIRLWHKLFGGIERRSLCGKHPRLWVFKIYKVGYYMSL